MVPPKAIIKIDGPMEIRYAKSFSHSSISHQATGAATKKAAPTMTAVTADTNSDGTVDRITITFSEPANIRDNQANNGLNSLAISNGCTISNG